MGIRKWIGNLLVNEGMSGIAYVPNDVREVLYKAIQSSNTLPKGSYRAYLVVKLGGCTLELVSLKGSDEVVTVDVHRKIVFDGEHAGVLQEMLQEGHDMLKVSKTGTVPVVEHRPVGLTLPGGPMVGIKLKPDPFGLHA
jgi:hypothetical protein